MKVAKRIIKYITYLLLSILVLFSLYTVVMTKIFHEPYVNVFGYTYFVVATGSMSGTVEVGDVVFVRINDSYQVGDIVTFKEQNSFITHRVMRVDDNRIITRGDVNNTDDEPVPKSDVIGRVVFVVSLAAVLKIVAFIIIVLFLYVVINFEKVFHKYIVKDKKKEKKKKTPLEYTQVIPIATEDNIPLITSTKDDVEILELEEETEFLTLVLKVLKSKNKHKKLKITTNGSLKLKYVYELALIDLCDPSKVEESIKKVPFEELYDYDFESISFTREIQNKLYVMPFYIFLMLLAYSLLYDENEFFDAIFKVMKYRILIDPDQAFVENTKRMNEVLSLVENIIKNVGHEEDFELAQIREKMKVNKEIQKMEIKE